jgi:threonine dehydrogenase-like Zn-dependent dehydrogenase
MDNVKVLLVKAEKSPHAGTENLPPNKLYLHPNLSVAQRQLGPLQDGYIRVEMLYAGICGTDIQVIQTNPETGHSMGSAPLVINEAGRVLGHEGVGRIVLAGAGVNHVGRGRYVTFESIITCRVCEACRRGNYNQCEHASLLGMEQDGLFGTTVDVPAWLAHDVSDLAESDKGVMAAACIEPAACAHVAAAIARIRWRPDRLFCCHAMQGFVRGLQDTPGGAC